MESMVRCGRVKEWLSECSRRESSSGPGGHFRVVLMEMHCSDRTRRMMSQCGDAVRQGAAIECRDSYGCGVVC